MRGECCQETRFQFVVPPGDPNVPVQCARELEFKEARIYVISVPVAGTVSVNGRVVGATHTPLEVPMEAAFMQAEISVTAEGYRAYTESRRLTAGGETARVRATLEEASGSAP
jgi:hypothetical protein